MLIFDHPTVARINIVEGEDNFELSMVGRFLIDRSINFNFMSDRLSHMWRSRKGVCISELDTQRYIFKFFHVVLLKRVIVGGPWTYDNHLLILHWIQPGEGPNQIPLNSIDIWVQIFDLPSGICRNQWANNWEIILVFFLHIILTIAWEVLRIICDYVFPWTFDLHGSVENE